MKPQRLAASALLISTFSMAEAATIQVSAEISALWPSGPGVQQGDNATQDTVDFPFANASASASLNNTLFFSEASASASGNGERGTVRSRSSVGADPNSDAFAASSAAVYESYTVEGSGTATVRFAVDGLISLNNESQFQASGFACIFCSSSNSRYETFTVESEGGFADEFFVTAPIFSVFGPTEIDVGFGLNTLVRASGGDGLVNFSNTGRAIIEFSEGLNARPNDPNFLSDPSYMDSPTMAPIPAPPAALLGLSWFGVMLLLGMRRRPYHNPSQKGAPSRKL